ncbi:MAG: M23 family metallopeptidase [Geobacteraceae bacterium]|nr:M23 family metallopeptidase [Geobacteraceae bacterium]
MKKFALLLLLLVVFAVSLLSCASDDPMALLNKKVDVTINDIPFQTEKYYRIPYTLKLWEYEKDGLVLEQIQILDYSTKDVLMTIDKAELPVLYKDPLSANPYFTPDTITNYYLSIQLPIPLANRKPARISHRFTFTDTIRDKTVTIEGAVFSPRLNETPLAIASPLKDNNMVFINQSTMAYHFYVLIFVDGNMYRGERFAFDSLQMNDDYSKYFDGDPKQNESYFNYKDTLYAVADGTVLMIKDGRPENNGDAKDAPITTLDELGGNYLVLDIGGGHYAFYAHCVPGSFQVKVGDIVTEGQPLALLGNSGNSDAPHLHFEITDGPDILFSHGVPFVLKGYTKLGEMESGPAVPVAVTNSMMEETTVIGFE